MCRMISNSHVDYDEDADYYLESPVYDILIRKYDDHEECNESQQY